MDENRVSSFDRNDMSLKARRNREVAETRTSRGDVAAPGRRRLMDIEDAVLWAIRDELPKRDMSPGGTGGIGFPTCSPMFKMVDLGVPIDECNFSREPGYPEAMGAPDPDALKIEAAIEALSRFKAAPVDELLELGPDFGASPEDERAAVQHAFLSIDTLVVRYAKLRRRPFWSSRPSMTKVVQPNGKPVVLRWETRTEKLWPEGEGLLEVLVPVAVEKRDAYPPGSYCPLQFDQDPKEILRERAEYLVWWAALNTLANDLFGELDGLAVLPPSAAQKPWLGDRERGKPPRIFDDLTARVYHKERRETAAAHRALGQRRIHAARRGAPATPIARRAAVSAASLASA